MQPLFVASKLMRVCCKQPSIFCPKAIAFTSSSMLFHPDPWPTGNLLRCWHTVVDDDLLECMRLIICDKPVRFSPPSNPSFFNWRKMLLILNSSRSNNWSKHQRRTRAWLHGLILRRLLCERNLDSDDVHSLNKISLRTSVVWLSKR